jgi:hypothetical protein
MKEKKLVTTTTTTTTTKDINTIDREADEND